MESYRKMKYPKCKLSNIINPGMYCVVSTDKEHVSEVLELEKNMKEEMFHDTSEFELCSQMCVAVTNEEEEFSRGIIKKKIGEDLYQVLLIDSGHVVHTGKSKIRVITNSDFMKIEPLAFTVKLYGLIPTTFVSVGTVRKPRACKEWSSESKEFVENLFKDNHKIVVQSILIQQRTVYGDLFIQAKPKMKFYSLRKLLCKNEFCVYSESHFLRQERIENSNDSSDLNRKMEFVEKWQRENFGLQERLFQVPEPFSSSKSNRTDSKRDCEQTPRVSDCKAEVPGATPVEPKALGVGRGKIKQLIAEMKKKATVSEQSGGSFQRESTSKIESQVSIGRGQFLKKYLQLRKRLHSDTEISQSSGSAFHPTEIVPERFLDVEEASSQECEINVPETVDKLKRVLIKPTDLSEFNDSNELTEVSLSTEGEVPPLVRNDTIEKKCASTVVIDDECSYQDQLKASSSTGKPNSAESRRTKDESPNLRGNGEKSNSSLKESVDDLGSSISEFALERWSGKKIWEQTPIQILSNTWMPYVRFDDSVVEPAKTFGELRIQPSVIKNLERGGPFNCLSQVQRWAIPAIRKQLNVIIIGSPKTGKTLSYIVPLMDYVQDESYFEELPQGNGPSVVVVASSSRICESIYYLCRSLLANRTKNEVKVVLAHGGGCEEYVWVTLTNGCDVLISTPHCLVRLLEMPVVTNFERLTCLVLDEIDVISQNPFRNNVRIILEKAHFSTKNRYYQKIFCGEKWTRNVENLVKSYVESYALVIGSYSEAVIYEGMKPSIYLVDRNQKAEVLLDNLKDIIGKRKILIACEETSEAVSLNEFLTQNGVFSVLAHEKIMANKLKVIREIWESTRDSVLVITDGVLNESNIRKAQTLVHYGLPNKWKTNFYLRYITLENFLRDPRDFSRSEDKSPANVLQDIILVDDESHCQLPHIVDFVTRLGGKVSTKVLDKCQEIRRIMEIQKCNSPICENLLAFGCCRNSKSCPRRHALVELRDSHGSLPTSGWVNFVVLRTHNASLFSVRPVEYIDSNGKISKLDDCSVELSSKLSEFYESESNRRPHGMPKVGDICAVKKEVPNAEVFYRAKIIEYLKVDKHDKPLEVIVKLIDQGDVCKRKSIELYELPAELSIYRPTAVDVRLVGLQPMDFDVSWSAFANDFVKKMMTQELKENQYWSGKIVLALDNTLFLDPVKRKEFLPQLNTHVFDLMVRDELLRNRIAVANSEHLPTLLQLCSEGGIEIPETGEIKKEDSAVVQPQWAFFDSTIDFIPVRFLAAENTSTIFLQIQEFEKLLRDLEEDCQKEGIKTSGEIVAKKLNSAPLTVGMFCLALFEDGKWNRGRIEEEMESSFHVYFVDHGDFIFVAKSDVVPISESLLLRLPCQAIECRLVGIEEKEECPLEVLEKIYAFSDDGKADLYASIARKDLKPNITGGRKYSINLIDEKGVSLNKMLVDCEMVLAEESEREHLINVEMEASDDEGGDGEGNDGDLLQQKEEDSALKIPDNYFLNLVDDMFEDDVAQDFLKEFASKVFNISAPCQENVSEETGTPTSNPPADACEESSKQGKPVQNVNEQHEELQKSDERKMKKEPELKGREGVLTPQVLWCQNQLEIQLKILLGNVKDYSLESTVNNISFRCFLGDKFYAMDLRLFGAVNPQMTKVTLKAFHVAVVLTKLAFPLWPRLHIDAGRFRWINLDVESLTDKEDVFSERIRSAKLAIEQGELKKGVRNETIFPCSDSEDSDECKINSDSEDSEDEY